MLYQCGLNGGEELFPFAFEDIGIELSPGLPQGQYAEPQCGQGVFVAIATFIAGIKLGDDLGIRDGQNQFH